MTTLEQKIEKYRIIELAANTVLKGSGELSKEQRTEYKKIFHEARIKRMSLQLKLIDRMEEYKNPRQIFIERDLKEEQKSKSIFDDNDEAKQALEEATNCLHTEQT